MKAQFDFDQFCLDNNYNCLINTKNKKNDSVCSNAILFNKSKYKCVFSNIRNRMAFYLFKNIDAIRNCPQCSKFSKNNHNNNNNNNNDSSLCCNHHSLFIVNCHLISKRDAHIQRFGTIKKMLSRIKQAIVDLKLNSDVNIIICGDFNTGIESVVMKYLLNRLKENNTSDEKEDADHDNDDKKSIIKNNDCGFNFIDAFEESTIKLMKKNNDLNCNSGNDEIKFDKYNISENIRCKYYPTVATENMVFAVDGILYSQNNSNVIRLNKVYDTIDDDLRKKLKWNETIDERIKIWDENGRKTTLCDYSNLLYYPNEDNPSDHMPVAAQFEWNSGKCSQTCQSCYNSYNTTQNGNKNKNSQKKGLTKKQRKKLKKKSKNVTKDFASWHSVFTF